MKHACRMVLAAFWLITSTVVFAADMVTISNAWVRTTAPGQQVGAAYLDIKSAMDGTLVKVETPAAANVEIHNMTMHGGVMRMRMQQELALPAGKTVSLTPGGMHLMLFGLKKPLNTGDNVVFTLSIKDRDGKLSTKHVSAPAKLGKD